MVKLLIFDGEDRFNEEFYANIAEEVKNVYFPEATVMTYYVHIKSLDRDVMDNYDYVVFLDNNLYGTFHQICPDIAHKFIIKSQPTIINYSDNDMYIAFIESQNMLPLDDEMYSNITDEIVTTFEHDNPIYSWSFGIYQTDKIEERDIDGKICLIAKRSLLNDEIFEVNLDRCNFIVFRYKELADQYAYKYPQFVNKIIVKN